MIFRITTCPECGKEEIHGPQTCGYQCSCGAVIDEDDEQLRTEYEMEHAQFLRLCCSDFNEFKERMEAWKKKKTYSPFYPYHVPNKDVLQFVKEKGEKR